ncbi:MAG: hypothetical protein ACYDDF_09040 [Thermoplasmatota archaeon]
MAEKKETRPSRELEFHFANEVSGSSDERIRKALERHKRRHVHM